VTFTRLEAALKAEAVDFQFPSFRGPPDISVPANALERGEGAGARGDLYGNP
jgi:hypothetical protein